jgi:hypothetical protein
MAVGGGQLQNIDSYRRSKGLHVSFNVKKHMSQYFLLGTKYMITVVLRERVTN